MSENNKFKLDSGAELLVTMGAFEDCKALHDAVIGVFLRTGVKEVVLKNVDVGRLILAAGADAEVQRCLFKCAERALYSWDGTEEKREKVCKGLFDLPTVGEKARKDYYPLFLKVATVNLEPFMQALFSMLSALPPTKADTPAQ